MRKMFFGLAALALLIGATANAQARDCDPRDGNVWKSSDETVAKIAAPLKQFNDGVQRAIKHYNIGGDISVVVVDCSYWGYDVLTRKVFAGMYGIYVAISYLKYTDAKELERKGITEACLIRTGGTEPSDENDLRLKQLYAQRCMAEMVGDKEMLAWLDRIMPTPREERNARADRIMNGAMKQIEQFLKGR